MLHSFTLLLIFAVLNNLAVNYSHSGRVGKAIEAYEQVVQIQNEDLGTPLLGLSTCEYET